MTDDGVNVLGWNENSNKWLTNGPKWQTYRNLADLRSEPCSGHHHCPMSYFTCALGQHPNGHRIDVNDVVLEKCACSDGNPSSGLREGTGNTEFLLTLGKKWLKGRRVFALSQNPEPRPLAQS